jgi:hypothetical protein
MGRPRRRAATPSSGGTPTAGPPSPSERVTFLDLSAALTGFHRTVLEGTGVVDAHCTLVREIVGADFFGSVMNAASAALGRRTVAARDRAIRTELVEHQAFGPLVSSLIALWYLGQWTALPDDWFAQQNLAPSPSNTTHVPPGAYVEALAYRAAGAHPPGARPPGHGSWSIPPLSPDWPQDRAAKLGKRP